MTDVFITSGKRNKNRDYFFYLTQEALFLNGFNAKIIEEPMLVRYFMCEQKAKSGIYILCDDDIIPSAPDTLIQLIELMKKNPDFSQIGLAWRKDMENERENTWITNRDNPELWEIDHCGGCVAIRRGTIRDLGHNCDYEKGIGDDKVMGLTARQLGYKVGIATKLYFHHLGIGHSTVWT